MIGTDWEMDTYNRVFDSVYGSVRREIEKNLLTWEELKRRIQAEYIYQGNDWDGGSGIIKQNTTEASIDAMERALYEWKQHL